MSYSQSEQYEKQLAERDREIEQLREEVRKNEVLEKFIKRIEKQRDTAIARAATTTRDLVAHKAALAAFTETVTKLRGFLVGVGGVPNAVQAVDELLSSELMVNAYSNWQTSKDTISFLVEALRLALPHLTAHTAARYKADAALAPDLIQRIVADRQAELDEVEVEAGYLGNRLVAITIDRDRAYATLVQLREVLEGELVTGHEETTTQAIRTCLEQIKKWETLAGACEKEVG